MSSGDGAQEGRGADERAGTGSASRGHDESARPVPAALTISVLGPLEVTIDGRAVPVAGERRRSLLVRLAIESGPIRAERLVDDLWGEAADEQSISSLRTYVTKLRRVLGSAADRLVSGRNGYELVLADDELDVRRFERAVVDAGDSPLALAEALAIWRGPALEEFASYGWALNEIARLSTARIATLERLTERLLDTDPRRAVAVLEAVVRECPYHERFHWQYAVALYRCGRSADALAAQRRGVSMLRDDLGLDPGPELAALENDLLSHADGLRLPLREGVEGTGGIDARAHGHDPLGRSSVPAAPDAPHAAAAGSWHGRAGSVPVVVRPHVDDPPFVSRRRELASLRQAWEAAADGCRLVVVSGEPGVGKTRLVGAFASIVASEGAVVLGARCDEDLTLPFGPLLEILEVVGAPPVATMPPEDVRSGAVAATVVVDAVARAVRQLTSGVPTVLVIDDAHWAGPSTWTAIRHLVVGRPDLPLLVVATVRSVDPPPSAEIDGVVATLRRQRSFDRVELEGLSLPDVQAMLDAERAVHLDAAEVFGRTGGNPFFVTELARWPDPETMPNSVGEVLSARVRSLSSRARELGRVAALLGLDFDLDLAATCGSDDALERSVAFDAVDELVASGFVVETGVGRHRFVHALAQQAFADDMTRTRRAAMHDRIADTLISRADETRSVPAALIAHHVERSGRGRSQELLAWRRRAGAEAMARHAFDDAALWFGAAWADAVDAPVRARVGLALDLAAAHARAGRSDAARDAAAAAATAGRAGGDPVAVAQAALWGSIGGRGASGWHADGRRIQLLEEAHRTLPSDHTELRVRVAGELALTTSALEHRHRRHRLASEAMELAVRSDDPAVRLAALPASRVAWFHPSDRARRAAFALEALQLAERTGDPWSIVDALDAVRTDAHESGDRATFDRAAERMVELASEVPGVHLRWRAGVTVAHGALIDGRLEEVPELAATALSVWGDQAAPDAITSYGSQVAASRMLAGDVAGALALLDGIDSLPERLAVAEAARAQLWARLGRVEDARRAIDEALHGCAGIPSDSGHLLTTVWYADAAAVAGHRPAVEQLVELLTPAVDLLPVMVGPGISWSAVASSLARLHRMTGAGKLADELHAHGVAVRGRFALADAYSNLES